METSEVSFLEYGDCTYAPQLFDSGIFKVVEEKEAINTGYTISDDIILSPTKFFLLVSNNVPYDWQCMLLNDDSQEITVRVGRQGGKSETVALKALHTALLTPKFNILIISPTLEQSRIIFTKIEEYMTQYDFIKNYVKRNTRTEIYFKNGSKIFVKASTSVRGHTIDLLIIDEAAFVDESVFVAAEPSLIGKSGKIIMISTPFGKIGKFYDSFVDKFYSKYHVPASQIPHIDKNMLEKQKERLSTQDYLREYDAEFIESAGAYFSLKTIKANSFLWDELPMSPRIGCDYYLGVDVSRGGTDETVYAIWEVSKETKTSRLIYIFEDEKITTGPHIEANIKRLNNIWMFKNICIDATGMGGYLYDYAAAPDLPLTPIIFNSKSPILGGRSHKTEMYEKLKLDMQKNAILRTKNMEFMRRNPLTGNKKKDLKIKQTWKKNLKNYILMIKSEPKLLNQLMDLKYKWHSSGNISVSAARERIHDDFPDAAALGYYAIFIDPYREMVSAAALGKR
jgi:hypothetical protein